MYKFLAILAGLIFLTQTAYAHPPSGISIAYKESTQAFTATINHRVSGKGHFINKIKVMLNGKEIQSKTFAFQNNKRIVSFTFPEPVYMLGDVLTIEVSCNRTGPSTKDFSIDRILEQYFLKAK